LAGKTAVITGAGGGIGRAIARVFVREGAKVLGADFSGAQNNITDDLGPNAVPFQADVTKESDVAAMYDKAVELFGRVDAAVHCAGRVVSNNPELSVENYQDFTQTNFLGVMLCCKHAVRVMLGNGGGSIVNVSSVASLNTEGMTALAYAGSKSAVNSVTKTMAVRHAADGIRVNAIAPGFTHSEINLTWPAEIIAELNSKSPMGRGGDPEEQGQVAAFLASDRASYVSGVIIPVDGAWSVRMV
jgi:NAD(P)-dependent dehydrogenase (short-subunit alcohol dehydrogenase family)